MRAAGLRLLRRRRRGRSRQGPRRWSAPGCGGRGRCSRPARPRRSPPERRGGRARAGGGPRGRCRAGCAAARGRRPLMGRAPAGAAAGDGAMVVARPPGRRPGEEGGEVRSEPAAESLLGDADFGGDAANSPARAVLGDHLLDGARPCRGVEIAARAPLPDVVNTPSTRWRTRGCSRWTRGSRSWTWNSGKAKS